MSDPYKAFAHDAPARHRMIGLADPDLTPSIQSIPSTVAAANALSGATFAEWYKCDLASGNLTGDQGTVLTKGAGTIRYEMAVPGWDGTDYTSSYRAIEFPGTAVNETFTAASSSVYQLDTSLAFVFCARLARAPAANRGVIGNRAGSAATNAGYHVQVTTTGTPALITCDGSTAVTHNGPGVSTALDALGCGSVQWFAVIMNLTSGNGQVLAYRDSGTATAMPTGTKTNANSWRLGGQAFLFSCELLQVLAFGVLTGANAEAFTITQLNALDNWCRPPTDITGHVRYHVMAPIVSASSGVMVQHLSGSATTTSLNQFAHAYAANATTTGSIGALYERGIDGAGSVTMRNRLLNTDDLANASWTQTNVTASAKAGVDPAGFTGAASLTASAANGTTAQSFTGEGDSEAVTVSVFVRRNGGSDVVGRLSLFETVGPSELSGTAFTATSTWQRVSLTVAGATVSTNTALQLVIQIDTDTESIFAWGAQANYKWLNSYQPQLAALVDRDNMEGYIDNTGNAVYDPVGGRVEVTCVGNVATVDSTGAFIFTTNCGASFEDRNFMQRDSDSTGDEGRLYDSAGTLVSQLEDWPALTHTDEITYAQEWDSRAAVVPPGVYARNDPGGTQVITGTVVASAGWTTGSNADRVYLGMRHTQSAHLEGIITRLKIWGRAG